MAKATFSFRSKEFSNAFLIALLEALIGVNQRLDEAIRLCKCSQKLRHQQTCRRQIFSLITFTFEL